MACSMRCSKGLKICCGVTATFLIIILVTLVVLSLTVFKPKDPTITLKSVKIGRWNVVVWPLPPRELNFSLDTVVTVDNPNHGSFSYHNSTAYLNYRGIVVAEAPIHEDTIPARGAHNISTILNFFIDDLTKIKDFADDFAGGVINFTSTATLWGKVRVLDLFKMKATSYSSCDISIFVHEHDRSVNSTCISKIKL